MNANMQPNRPPGAPDQAYLSDLEALRKRAREQIMKGAVTPSFPEEHAEDLVDLLEDVPKD